MNKTTSTTMIARTLFSFLLLLTTVGCDGGLFGTGDGSEIVLPTDGSSSAPTPPIDGDPDLNPPDQPAAPDESETTPNRELNNFLGTGNRELPLVTLINTSSQPLNVVSDVFSMPQSGTSVEPGFTSQYIELPQNQSSLIVINGDNSQPVFRFSPLALDVSSVTTLLAYDTPVSLIDTPRTPALNVIALPTLTQSSDSSVATLRIVQSTQLDANDTAATMTLIPEGSNPGSGEVNFNDMSLANASASTYSSVNAGTYQLQDSLARFAPVPISVEAASVYTLVITGNINPVLIISEDSDVIIQTNTN